MNTFFLSAFPFAISGVVAPIEKEKETIRYSSTAIAMASFREARITTMSYSNTVSRPPPSSSSSHQISLSHWQTISFSLTQEEMSAARDDNLKVQIRLDVSRSRTPANFKALWVNARTLRAHSSSFSAGTPIDITTLCRRKEESSAFFNWTSPIGFGHDGPLVVGVSVRFFPKQSVDELLMQVETRKSEVTTAAIVKKLLKKKEKDCSDVMVTTTSCKVSLICPIGKVRMTHPCRSKTCDHFQCFDAKHFLAMNENSPRWRCPICNRKAWSTNIYVDEYFQDILGNPLLSKSDDEVVLLDDGTWKSLPAVSSRTTFADYVNVSAEDISGEDDEERPPLKSARKG